MDEHQTARLLTGSQELQPLSEEFRDQSRKICENCNYCVIRGLTHSLAVMIFFLQNLETSCKPIVTKPKPKVEPPKDTAPEKTAEGEPAKTEGEPAETEGEPAKTEGEAEGTSNSGAQNTEGGTGTQGGDEKMEEDPPKGDTEDMELD